MGTTHKLAVVILNWNGQKHLETYLPVVLQHSDLQDVQIILADNGSTDQSIQYVRNQFPNIHIIELDRNYGFAGGYNRALKQVDAEYYCLLNSDVRVTQNWIEPILSIFETEPEIAAIQPKILSDRDWSRFEHAGAAGGFVDKYGYPFCRGRIMNAIEYDRGQYNQSTDILWASGACLFIRSSIFHQAKGFDDDYFAHMEEIDLCWRIKNQGYRIIYTPQSKIYHWGGATLEYNNPHKLFLNFRNSLWTLYKNHTGKGLNILITRRMIIDTVAIAKFFFTFEWKSMSAVVRAHMAFHSSKKVLKEKRKSLLSKVTSTSHHEILNESIVKNFFIRNKRVFNDFTHFKANLRKGDILF